MGDYMNPKILSRCNQWMREHSAATYSSRMNVIRLTKGNLKHNMKLCEVCCHLLENEIPFYTEVPLKYGVRPDIVCPTNIKSIIEIMNTEEDKDFAKNKSYKYPKDIINEMIFIDCDNEFNIKDVL